MSFLASIKGPIAVVGLGATGLSVVRFLAPHVSELGVFDRSPKAEAKAQLHHEFPQVYTSFGELDWAYLDRAEALIMSPGVCPYDPMWHDHHREKMISDIEIFAQEVKVPVIAITGSNGKSTVSALLAHSLVQLGYAVALGANFGPPALQLLNQPNLDYVILELSSFQLALTKHLCPHLATVLNCTPDHLDWHHDMHDYLQAKQRIFINATHIVVNRDQPETYSNLDAQAVTVGFSCHAPQHERDLGLQLIAGEQIVVQGNKSLVKSSALAAPLMFQLYNNLAVLALLDCLGISTLSAVRAMQGFKALPHRCAYVGHYAGKDWYNDSKATNSAAMLAAVSSLADRYEHITLLAGGIWKEEEPASFSAECATRIEYIILFGQDAKTLYTMWHKQHRCVMVEDLQAAVAYANKVSTRSSVVVLSPACASFDQFEHYQQRGDHFVDFVKNGTT